MKRRRSYYIFYSLFSILLLSLLLSPTLAKAQNKMGIHIGSKFELFDKAATTVGSGGWVVVMGCPGDGDALAEMVQSHPEVNIIIRGHYPAQPLNREWARSWAATIGSLPTNNKIYFVPWNEPNQAGSDDWGAPSEVVTYVNDLVEALDESRLRGSKMILLSPMLNHTWQGGTGDFDAYVNSLRSIDNDFFAQFDGIAMNLYDFGEEDYCGSTLCSSNPHRNPARFSELLNIMGASGKPVFGVESGTAGQNFYWRTAPSSNSPLYRFVQAFATHGQRMFAIPAYDLAGERGHSWSLFEPRDTANLISNLGSGQGPCCTEGASDTPGFEVWRSANAILCPEAQYAWATGEVYCSECGGAAEIYYAPIGYLDQMNVVAEKEIDPYQPEEPWYWAECWNPSIQSWDMNCVEAKNKMGFSSEAPLYYPQPLQDWHDYIVYHVLPRRVPYHLQDEVVKKVQEGELAAQGWIEFETSGENNDQKRTQITNPRAWLFQAKFVGNLSYATNWIWQSFTGLYNQGKKPTLVRDGRDTHPGYETASDGMVDFGALAGPAAGLFAADKTKGSCLGKDPNLDCDAEGACSYRCCEKRMWIEPVPGVGTSVCIQWRDEKEEVWAMRVINPEVNAYSSLALFGHDKIETLNSGWPELANAWNNIANPINGFVPAIAREYNLEVEMGDDCEDLFGSKEIWEEFNQAATPVDKLGKSICSWRYAKTPFSYSYGPFVAGVETEAGMEPQACAGVLEPESLEETETEKQCYAHWPFVGGLEKVYEFINQFINTYRHYGLAVEPIGEVVDIKSGQLVDIFEEAAGAFDVPVGVLIGIAHFEGYHPSGPHLFDYPDEWIEEDIDPYCATSPEGAKGPMQFMPDTWETYKNAAKKAGVRHESYQPNICSIIDSIYAAAEKASVDVKSFGDSCACGKGALAPGDCAKAPAPTSVVDWSKADVYHIGCHYQNDCSSGYCETVWQFYQSSLRED